MARAWAWLSPTTTTFLLTRHSQRSSSHHPPCAQLRVGGFEHFFIADNASDDGTWELLQALESLGYLKCFRFPNPPGQAPQLPAYVELMRRFGSEVDWMAFIDADEFVWPTNRERTAVHSLAGLASRPEIGAIVLNWAIHGSSWHTNHAAGLVTERFERRALRRFKVNHHYKAVLRTAAWTGAFNNPHEPPLEDPWWVVHANGAPVIHHPKHGRGLSNQVIWDVMRLNHYAVRSRQEFDERKRPKGSSSSLTRVKGDKYFSHHDRNDVSDPMPKWALSRLAEEVARIETALRSAGHAPPQRATAAVVLVQPFQGTMGSLDDVSLNEGHLVLKGWALEGTGAPPQRLAVELGGHRLESSSFGRYARADIKRKYPMCTLECGYEWSIPASDLPALTLPPSQIQFYGQLADGGWSAPFPQRVGCFGANVLDFTAQKSSESGELRSSPVASSIPRIDLDS